MCLWVEALALMRLLPCLRLPREAQNCVIGFV